MSITKIGRDWRARALAGLAVVSLIVGCSTGGSGSEEPTAEAPDVSTVTVAMTASSEPDTGFDPVYGWGSASHVHEPLVQSTLIKTDVDLGFENDLATDYSVSDDGMTWKFTIRDDAKFTNGNTVTAKDVAFTINEVVTNTGAVADLNKVKEATATSDTEVEIAMKQPDNTLLYTLAVLGIVPADEYGDNYGKNPIGSGRYKLESWEQGKQAIFVANPDYYGEAPKMERLVVVFMDEDAGIAAVKAGQVDVAYVSATHADQHMDGYELFSAKTVDSRGISFPVVPEGSPKREGMDGAEHEVGNNVTSDRALRQAMNYAVDRDVLADHVLNGHGTPAYSVADGMPWASDAMKVETDVDKAKTILEDAGWAEGDDGVRVKHDGTRAEFTLVYPATDPVRQALAAEFANQMKEIGINITIEGKSWDDIYLIQTTEPVVWGWGSNSPNELYSLYHSQSTSNTAAYESDTIDEYLDKALAATDIDESNEYWQKAQWDGTTGVTPEGEATWVWLTNIDHLYFVRDNLNIGEQKPHPHGHGWSVVNNVDQWTWES
ncbi:ABC transporter substrate-binding protein [Actinobaculum suis]|uniref:ABC transporter substrate-binding protein n=1 Tax=Actinobaculum suis TaxID=1657 RepID=UPI0008086F2C|nr:ABC transporter substrate-binding protein [Actinobaculum suis]OCA96117.1 ABC transporter substrate-binding protein [Actinobaculum suis]OCA96260.1 ABC transporter substrate-binding protein [Actinobaculum suis]